MRAAVEISKFVLSEHVFMVINSNLKKKKGRRVGRRDGRVVKGTEGESGARYVTLRKDCYCRLTRALLSLKRKEGGGK